MGRVLNALIKTNEGRNPFVGIPLLLTKTFFEFDLLRNLHDKFIIPCYPWDR